LSHPRKWVASINLQVEATNIGGADSAVSGDWRRHKAAQSIAHLIITNSGFGGTHIVIQSRCTSV